MIRNALYIFGICTAIFVFFMPSYLQMQELHQRNSSYDHKIRELSAENDVLQEERRRLEQDPEYLARVGREKFGIIKEDEVIYKILPQGQKPSVPAEEKTAEDKKSLPSAAETSKITSSKTAKKKTESSKSKKKASSDKKKTTPTVKKKTTATTTAAKTGKTSGQ